MKNFKFFFAAIALMAASYTNENSVLTLTSPTEASFNTRARETFAYTQPVTISNTSAVDISATLNRIVSMLTVKSSDGKTADVSNVRMTFSAGGKDFNPTTGLAITTTGLTNTVGNSASVGSTSTSSTMFFLNSDEQDIDVTIETLVLQRFLPHLMLPLLPQCSAVLPLVLCAAIRSLRLSTEASKQSSTASKPIQG